MPNINDQPDSFLDYLSRLPMVAWAHDNLKCFGSTAELANDIKEGKITCVADGSFKDQHGTAAWKILNLENPKNAVEGQCITPGSPEQQNAYRSELSGVYAGISVINALVEYYEIQQGSVVLACDNLGAINITSYDSGGVNPVSCAQFDLVMAIQSLKLSKIQWNHVHVDGHQDDNKDHVLSAIERLNVEMDSQAKAHWARTKNTNWERVHQFEGDLWNVLLAEQKLSKTSEHKLLNGANDPEYRRTGSRKSDSKTRI